MGRQPKYSAEQLLDAAAALAAEGGPTAVTMTAVAASVGAPSGSVYHRFADRAALLAALWKRVTVDVHGALVAELDGDPHEAAVRVARTTVRWCQRNHDLARVLLAGRDACGAADWSAADRAEIDAEQAAFEARMRAMLIGARHPDGGVTGLRVALAVLDLPYAAVRRYLDAGRPVPRGLDAAVAGAAQALLRPEA